MTIDAQTYTATVAGTALSVLDGEITLDDSWAPYVQGQLTVLTPPDPNILDPRTLATIDVTMTQRFGDGLQHTSDLTALYAGLTTAAITTAWANILTSAITALIGAWNGSRIAATALGCLGLYIIDSEPQTDGTTRLQVAGGEHRPQQLRDWSRYLVGSVPATLRDIFPVLSPGTIVVGDQDFIIPTASRSALFGAPVEAPGQDQWEPLQAFALMAGLRLWCHPDGLFRLTPAGQTVPGLVDLTDAVDVKSVISRTDDSWADGVIVQYLEDPAGLITTYFQSTDLIYATKVVLIELNVVTPFDGNYAGNAALDIRDRMITRGRTLEVTAVSRFDTAPNMAATIDQPALPWLPETNGVVDAVTFHIAARTMTVTVRDLEEV